MNENPYESPRTESEAPVVPRGGNFGGVLAWILIGVAISGCLLAVVLPGGIRSVRPAARRVQCSNNLKQIGLALQNYHDKYGQFPPAYTVDSQENPLHSWRTLILPFMEQQALYDTIDLDKPWDDPANAAAREAVVPTYRCPGDTSNSPPNHTTYMAVVAPGGCFAPAQSCSLDEITDAHNGTLLVIELRIDQSAPWMAPRDADLDSILAITQPKSALAHQDGSMALMADGSVHFLSSRVEASVLRALVTIAGDDDKQATGF